MSLPQKIQSLVFLSQLSSKTTKQQARLIQKIGNQAPFWIYPFLRKYKDHQDVNIRTATATALTYLGQQYATRDICEMYKNAATFEEKTKIMNCLARIGDETSLAQLLNIQIEAPEIKLRLRASWLVDQFDEGPALKMFLSIFKTANLEVKELIIQKLGSLQHENCYQFLVQIIQDDESNEQLKVAAIESITPFNRPQTIPLLQPFFFSSMFLQLVSVNSTFRHTCFDPSTLIEEMVQLEIPDASYFHQLLLHALQNLSQDFIVTDNILTYLLTMLKSEVMNNRYLSVECLTRVTLRSNLTRLYNLYLVEEDPQLKETAHRTINGIIEVEPHYILEEKIPFDLILPQTLTMTMVEKLIKTMTFDNYHALTQFFTFHYAHLRPHLPTIFISAELTEPQKILFLPLLMYGSGIYTEALTKASLINLNKTTDPVFKSLLIRYLGRSKSDKALTCLLDLDFRVKSTRVDLLTAIGHLIRSI